MAKVIEPGQMWETKIGGKPVIVRVMRLDMIQDPGPIKRTNWIVRTPSGNEISRRATQLKNRVL